MFFRLEQNKIVKQTQFPSIYQMKNNNFNLKKLKCDEAESTINLLGKIAIIDWWVLDKQILKSMFFTY